VAERCSDRDRRSDAEPVAPSADGPANLLAAVQLASSPDACGLGILVVFNDEIHAARFVAKTHTSRLSAFRSPPLGPLGWLTEGRPVIAARPMERMHLHVTSDASVPPVALLRAALDDDGRLLAALPSLGFAGAVIEGFGGGHVTPPMVPLIARLAARTRAPGSSPRQPDVPAIGMGGESVIGARGRVFVPYVSRDAIKVFGSAMAVCHGPARPTSRP
jgi:hypothetical protein